jgi:NAD(P)-dependent dehydrogenase (short-subunit alcohol dehydrogenase family)
VWLVTGASSGLGRAIAEAVIARADMLVGTARDPRALDELVERAPERIKAMRLDVRDLSQIEAVVAGAVEAFGRVDVLINNAGYGLFGAAEESSDEQVRAQLDTNLLGSIRMVKAVIGSMRARGSGRIIQISSEGAQMVHPGLSVYHASKWGIDGFCEALAGEVQSFGLRVMIVEPGAIRTDWAGKNRVDAQIIAAYEATAVGALRKARDEHKYPINGDPKKMAEAIVSSAVSADPPLRLALGSDAYRQMMKALEERLAALKAQEAVACSTDAQLPTTPFQ